MAQSAVHSQSALEAFLAVNASVPFGALTSVDEATSGNWFEDPDEVDGRESEDHDLDSQEQVAQHPHHDVFDFKPEESEIESEIDSEVLAPPIVKRPKFVIKCEPKEKPKNKPTKPKKEPKEKIKPESPQPVQEPPSLDVLDSLAAFSADHFDLQAYGSGAQEAETGASSSSSSAFYDTTFTAECGFKTLSFAEKSNFFHQHAESLRDDPSDRNFRALYGIDGRGRTPKWKEDFSAW